MKKLYHTPDIDWRTEKELSKAIVDLHPHKTMRKECRLIVFWRKACPFHTILQAYKEAQNVQS
jgi:hypothetical protein